MARIARALGVADAPQGLHDLADSRVDLVFAPADHVEALAVVGREAAQVTEAEGKKRAVELNADAELYAAEQSAKARRVLADAEAYAVNAVAKAISSGGESAVAFEIKKIQAHAVQELSKGSNAKIVLVPTDVLNSLSGTLGRLADRI